MGVIKVSGKCLDWLKQCINTWFISIRCDLKMLIIDVRGGAREMGFSQWWRSRRAFRS